MSAHDYGSTARSLAIHDTSPHSTPTTTEEARPARGRRRSTTSSQSRVMSGGPRSARDKLIDKSRKAGENLLAWFKSLRLWQRVVLVVGVLVLNVAFILFWVYNEDIMTALYPIAQKWSERNGGWTLIWFMIIATAFPPLVGYSSAVTIAGFTYGFWRGWFIAASANVIGSFCAFLSSRYLFRGWMERKVGNDKRFAALSLVLKHDGLKLLTMIRLCPFPYSLSNGALATFPTVNPVLFAVATALASPKLMIHIFVGTRFAELGRESGEMDWKGKAIQYMGIGIGTMIGVVTGYLIYNRTKARARQLEAEEQSKLEQTSPLFRQPHPIADASGQPFDDTDVESDTDSNDDIDFLDPPGQGDSYRDDLGEEEQAIGLQKQHSRDH